MIDLSRLVDVDLVVAKFRDGAKHCVCGRSVMNNNERLAMDDRELIATILTSRDTASLSAGSQGA